MRVGFASLKGSPGATTIATMAAAMWPNPRRILIEADLDGSTLGPRFAGSLHPEPNVMHLATECRHDVIDDGVLRQTQKLPFGVDVVVGGFAPSVTLRSVRELVPRLDDVAAAMPTTDWLFDLGRLRSGDTSTELANALDVVFVCVNPTFDQLEPLLRRINELAALHCDMALVVVGDGEYDPADIDAEVRAKSDDRIVVGGAVPFDAKTTRLWNDGAVSGDPKKVRRLMRREMMRAVRSIVSSMIDVTPAEVSKPNEAELLDLTDLDEEGADQ